MQALLTGGLAQRQVFSTASDKKHPYFRQISELRRKLLIVKTSILLLSLLLVGFACGEDNETKVQFKDLPPAVQNIAKEQQRSGAAVRGYSKENENGKTFYEVETRVNGKSRDILVEQGGAIVEIEQQVEIGSLPVAARHGLQREAAGSNILHVESVTRGDKVSYEAVILRNAKKKEIAVNADGSASHPE